MCKKRKANVKEAEPRADDLKIRVLKAKQQLPSSGVTSLYFHYYKEHEDSAKNRAKLTNVLQTRITDVEITERLEDLVKLLTKSKN